VEYFSSNFWKENAKAGKASLVPRFSNGSNGTLTSRLFRRLCEIKGLAKKRQRVNRLEDLFRSEFV
jgi:hypothetical protein